jgi:CO/xanthine dehydrogenase FAD-binding subunit
MAVLVPATLDDALAVLARTPDATVLAGGTDLMVDVNEGRRRPRAVVCVARIPALRERRIDDGTLVLGAATTYTDLLEPDVVVAAPSLAAAARTVGSPQIRNAGTIGGNLATASPAGDTLPVLVALRASVDIDGPNGARRIPIAEFLVGPKRNALQPGELIVGVRVPIARGPQHYLKVGTRNAMVIAVASIAFALDLDARRVGLGLGSVGPTALAAPNAAAWLEGRLEWRADGVSLRDPAHLATFGDLTANDARAIDDHRSTARYREHAVRVLAQRALRRSIT